MGIHETGDGKFEVACDVCGASIAKATQLRTAVNWALANGMAWNPLTRRTAMRKPPPLRPRSYKWLCNTSCFIKYIRAAPAGKGLRQDPATSVKSATGNRGASE